MNMNINIHHIDIYFCHSVTICFCHRYKFFCVKSGWGMLVYIIYSICPRIIRMVSAE